MAYFDSVAKSTKDFFKRVREGSVRCGRRERAAGTDMSGTHAQAASLPPPTSLHAPHALVRRSLSARTAPSSSPPRQTTVWCVQRRCRRAPLPACYPSATLHVLAHRADVGGTLWTVLVVCSCVQRHLGAFHASPRRARSSSRRVCCLPKDRRRASKRSPGTVPRLSPRRRRSPWMVA